MARKTSTGSEPEIKKNERNISPLEKQLADFEQKCIKEFDVAWVVQQFRPEQNTPSWFRKILTLMLLGWAFYPNRPSIRISLAWQQVNSYQHKLITKKLDRSRIKDYNIELAIQLADKRNNFSKLFVLLGGLNSYKMLSRGELAAWLAEGAKHSGACLVAINIITFLHQKKIIADGKSEASFKTALKLLDQWIKVNVTPRLKEGKKAELYKVLLNPKYGLHVQGMSVKKIENSWRNCRFGIEFLVSLLTLQQSQDWKPIRQSKNQALQDDCLNAYSYIQAYKFNLLPLDDPKFQNVWLSRAKYFSNMLDKRDIPDLALRFTELSESPAPFELVLVDELQAARIK